MDTLPERKISGCESIGRLTHKHLAEIQAIASQSFDTVWSERDFAYFLAERSFLKIGISIHTQLAAYAIALLSQGDLDIVSVATRPSFRRHGLATSLLKRLLSAGGVQRAFLEVEESNLVARNLYEKLGFSKTHVRRGYYRGKKDAICMRLIYASESKPGYADPSTSTGEKRVEQEENRRCTENG